MPFITEEIWSYLPKTEVENENTEGFLIKASWPVEEKYGFEESVKIIEMTMDAIRSIRNIRAEADAAPSRKLRATILPAEGRLDVIKAGERHIKNLANITEISFITDKAAVPEDVMSAVIDGAEIFIPLDDLLDYKAEQERLQKEQKKLLGEVSRLKGKLSNEGFINKAPEKVVAEEREKLAKYEDMLEKVVARLSLVEKKL
jgi:valyl-tRNA synthetase